MYIDPTFKKYINFHVEPLNIGSYENINIVWVLILFKHYLLVGNSADYPQSLQGSIHIPFRAHLRRWQSMQVSAYEYSHYIWSPERQWIFLRGTDDWGLTLNGSKKACQSLSSLEFFSQNNSLTDVNRKEDGRNRTWSGWKHVPRVATKKTASDQSVLICF